MIELLVSLALLGNGVTSGIMLSTVMGIGPLTVVQSYRSYVETIQYLWRRYDPFMPIVHGLTVVAGLVLTVVAPGPAGRLLFGAATAVLVIVMVISVVKNVPINRYVMSLDPGAEPPDWAERDPRARWAGWNRFRTALALAAFALNTAGAVALI
ncbi:DUF1772 domain-containing protein [Rhizohabitans arisaemae]|uniref:DUF1772 domain-containing protein n=1 Tax=Rhizohabitans arisaemae TaxID=2720610 RepID=UPI0024B04ED8|nr:DUF1772 domain-containing protein [Rhizohabitans arisaemae]